MVAGSVGLVAVAAVVVVVMVVTWRSPQEAPPPSPPAFNDVSRPGDYSNPYLGFRVRYGDEWLDITQSRGALTERTHSRNGALADILLALAWNRPDRADYATKVVFHTEFDPVTRDATADVLIDRINARHRVRKQLVGEPKDEGSARIAGVDYRRESLRQTWRDRDIGTTYWVALHREYNVVIAATYEEPEGLAAIEKLLSQVTTLPAE